MRISSAQEFSDFRNLTHFVHTEYTSNMAVCYDNEVNYVTAPHV